MAGKITYTPFISKPIPESSAISPIPISFPISEYLGADPDREVIPVQYTPPKTELEVETTTEESSNPFKWARLTLHSAPETRSGKIYSDKKKFKADLKSAYEKELQSRGISTDYADYMVAQDALESG
jgi:flagellum-specific peptidoglycan hydrolase FlgJ